MYHFLNIFIAVDDAGNPEGAEDALRSLDVASHIAGMIGEGYREGEVTATLNGETIRGYWHTEYKTA